MDPRVLRLRKLRMHAGAIRVIVAHTYALSPQINGKEGVCMKTQSVLVLVTLAVMTFACFSPPTDAMAQPRNERSEPRDARQAPPRAPRYPPVGREVRTLPPGERTVRVRRQDYHYFNGIFYRPLRPDVFVVVDAPFGARVRHLPPGSISFLIGPSRYFYANYTYYLWEPRREEYIVVEEPPGAAQVVADAAKADETGELFVYPSEGQSDEQRDRDRYECYVWAAGQTGFDPAADSPQTELTGNYRRALSACLEGRGYTVK